MLGVAALLSSCSSGIDKRNKMIISARDQRLLLLVDRAAQLVYQLAQLFDIPLDLGDRWIAQRITLTKTR